MNVIKKYLLLLFLVLQVVVIHAQQSDNENGNYTNPIIWADFPDPDVLQVGDWYYMVSTTVHIFPGVPFIKSRDLVNWEYATNIVDRFDFHPYFNIEGGTRYSRGQWATSLKYHDGIYYALFVTLDEGGFLCTTTDIEGDWDIMKLEKAYYDPGLFFDDDGKTYVFHGYSTLSLTEVNKEDLSPVSQDSVIFKDPYSYIQAEKEAESVNIVMGINENRVLGKIENYEGDNIYFRAFVSTISDKATFYYSSDNKSFKKLGESLDMEFRLTVFTGNKFSIFNYATQKTGGYVDVDWFRMETKTGPRNLYSAQSMIEAEWYDHRHDCDTEWMTEKAAARDQNMTLIRNGSWLKFDQIDFWDGVAFFYAHVAAGCAAGGTIELQLDMVDGPIIRKCRVALSDSWDEFRKIACPVDNVKGIRSLVLRFVGADDEMLMKLNWFSFNRRPLDFKNHPDDM